MATCVCVQLEGYDMLSEVPRAWPPVCVCAAGGGMICFLKCHVHGLLCVCAAGGV